MKILFVLHSFAPECVGGTERTVEALARACAGMGHEVVVVAGTLVGGPPDSWRELDHDGLRVVQMPREDLYFESWFKSWSPTVSAAFAKLLDTESPDIVHVHHWLRLTSDLVRVAASAGATTVVTVHDYYPALASPVRKLDQLEAAAPEAPGYVSAAERDEAFAFHRADFVDELRAADLRLAPTLAHAAGVQAMLPAEVGEFVAHAPPMLQRPRRLPERSQRRRRLVAWGTWYPDKGLEAVLDALRRVPDAGWSLTILGEPYSPEYGADLERRAHGLAVEFRGRFDTDGLEAIDADYAVLPSTAHESYGLVLDEAMCLGLPVLGVDVPAYRERIDARCALWFSARDVGAWADALQSGAPEALGRPQAPAMRTAEQAGSELLALYEQALATERLPPPVSIDANTRARMLHARAERRLWTALQQSDPPAPPDSFLR